MKNISSLTRTLKKAELISQLVTSHPQAEILHDFKVELAKLLEHYKVGLQVSIDHSSTDNQMVSDSLFSACSISITPWQISENAYLSALATAQALSALFRKVSCHHQFLTQALDDFVDESSLIFQLKANLLNRDKQLATGLNLSRQDLLLDKTQQWRLVESNSIAAGMGPFCEALREIQTSYLENPDSIFPQNPATGQIAKHLYDAAFKRFRNPQPLIIFVVTANEDNIHDQNKIAVALTNLGAQVVRKTLEQLSKELISNNQKQLLLEHKPVDCFYFRTGYNLSDYKSLKDNFSDFLNLRFWIEQHQVVVAPSCNQQLATSKWVQMKLSFLSVMQLAQLFDLKQAQAELAVKALNLKYIIPESLDEIDQYLTTGDWILKTQNEGGGNVADKNALKLTEQQPDAQFMLMQKIDTVIREDGLIAFSHNQFKKIPKAISEFGILTVGEKDQYGGYLLRSKSADQLETGVHQAGGVLDTLMILTKPI